MWLVVENTGDQEKEGKEQTLSAYWVFQIGAVRVQEKSSDYLEQRKQH